MRKGGRGRWLERMRMRVGKEEEGSDPIWSNFDLSKERNSMDMNNSNQLINNFSKNRLQSVRNEGRNWLASFTKTGCVSCRDEGGKLNHKGRDGRPRTLLIGDESVPSIVGYTKGDRTDGQENACLEVLNKGHLGLDEV